jgi:hypothetical protein
MTMANHYEVIMTDDTGKERTGPLFYSLSEARRHAVWTQAAFGRLAQHIRIVKDGETVEEREPQGGRDR